MVDGTGTDTGASKFGLICQDGKFVSVKDKVTIICYCMTPDGFSGRLQCRGGDLQPQAGAEAGQEPRDLLHCGG